METKNFRLRRFQSTDLENMVSLESDPEVMKFIPLRVTQTRESTQRRLEKLIENEQQDAPLGVWAAEFKDSHEFVGWFMLSTKRYGDPELGFMILQKFWGSGHTTEIGQRLIEYAFSTLNTNKIVAGTDSDNKASKKVLTKLGFKLEKSEPNFNFYVLYSTFDTSAKR